MNVETKSLGILGRIWPGKGILMGGFEMCFGVTGFIAAQNW